MPVPETPEEIDVPPMPPVEALLCFALYGAGHEMTRAYQPLLAALGLTYPQYLVLLSLWRRDGQGVGEIGAALGLETNTLTPLLKRMEAAGLVARSRDRRDERQVRVTLTGAGRAMEARAAHVPACIAQATGMTMAEMTALRDALQRLRQDLAARSGAPG